MKALKDIIKLAPYKPSGGLKGELYHLVKNLNYDSTEVKQHFQDIGKVKQLYSVNRHLKESLLSSILTMPLHGIKKSIATRIKLLRKQLQVRILLYIGSSVAGVRVAIDTIVIAEQNEEFEIVYNLCRELIREYSTIQKDNIKYKKYREKFDKVEVYLRNEVLAEKTYRDLLYAIHTKSSIDNFDTKIKSLDAVKNDNYKFNYFYFTTKSVYYQLIDNYTALIDNNKKAHRFFNSLNFDTHYIAKVGFLSDLIPYYIINEQFGNAETTINTCLDITPNNSYNWHRILIYKALLGFYSDKPRMSLKAYKTAHILKKRFKNKAITETWHLIKGYLVLLEKVDKLDKSDMSESFRLRKYLNIEEQQRNDEQKANLLVLELLHLLVDNERVKFFEKQERVEGFIQSRFRAHRFKRTRHFLRLLKSVVRGNYHPVGVKAHAERQIKNLSKSKIDINVIDVEVVPYEVLWNLVFTFLGRKGKTR